MHGLARGQYSPCSCAPAQQAPPRPALCLCAVPVLPRSTSRIVLQDHSEKSMLVQTAAQVAQVAVEVDACMHA